SCRLTSVERAVTLRVIPHQNLAEGRLEGFNVFGEIFAVLKIEFLLPTLFSWACGRVATFLRTLEDRGAELLVHQDARLPLRHSVSECSLEAVVDHLLGGGDLGRLFGCQCAGP